MNRLDFQNKISELILNLSNWRIQWNYEHPNAVWEACRHSTDDVNTIFTLEEILSKSLEFSSVSLALEILYYDTALIQLMQLEKTISYPSIQKRMVRREDLPYICQMAYGANGNGLLLPNQVGFQIQPAIEAFRITQFIMKKLENSYRNTQYIPPSPFGIIYWALMDDPEIHSCVAPILFECPPFNENREYFDQFKADFHNVVGK